MYGCIGAERRSSYIITEQIDTMTLSGKLIFRGHWPNLNALSFESTPMPG
jgi:hypothetical protein